MNKYINDISIIQVQPDIKVPPRAKNFRSSHMSEHREKQTKTSEVARNAVGTMVGSMLMTCSKWGPMLTPVRNEKPIRMPNRLATLAAVGVIVSNQIMRPIDPKVDRSPAENILVKT